MPITDLQNWKQVVRDGSGNPLAERDVPLTPNVSNVRRQASRFLRYILDNRGDLKSSVEAELRSARKSLADLLKQMDSSRDQDEIRHLRDPMSIRVALASYLEQALEETPEMARPMSAGEFTAGTLEEQAAKMPPSMKDDADALRRAAQIYREVGGDRTVRVWNLPSEDSQNPLQ